MRRFDVEHTFCFFKQTLNWTLPPVRHPEQADRWTWLVVLAYTQLRLARPLVVDQRVPWQRPQPAGKLTPARVQRGVSRLLPRLPVLACPPKPCGRSPGTSQRQALRSRHPLSGSDEGHPQRLPSRINQPSLSPFSSLRLLLRLVARLLTGVNQKLRTYLATQGRSGVTVVLLSEPPVRDASIGIYHIVWAEPEV